MKYLIYLAVAGLTVWAVWYLVRQVRRQLRGGGCGCGGSLLLRLWERLRPPGTEIDKNGAPRPVQESWPGDAPFSCPCGAVEMGL